MLTVAACAAVGAFPLGSAATTAARASANAIAVTGVRKLRGGIAVPLG
jgi:hypothetical protein